MRLRIQRQPASVAIAASAATISSVSAKTASAARRKGSGARLPVAATSVETTAANQAKSAVTATAAPRGQACTQDDGCCDTAHGRFVCGTHCCPTKKSCCPFLTGSCCLTEKEVCDPQFGCCEPCTVEGRCCPSGFTCTDRQCCSDVTGECVS
jgi:hypothetical protein